MVIISGVPIFRIFTVRFFFFSIYHALFADQWQNTAK